MLYKRTILAAALAGGGLGLANAPAAHAAYTVTFSEVGSDVVANGSGSIDLSGLVFNGNSGFSASVLPSTGLEFTGSTSSLAVYEAFTGGGPSGFGPGGLLSFATSGSGDLVGLEVNVGPLFAVFVPSSYVSGAPLNGTATYTGQSLASLGLTPGTYTYTFGSGASADAFTVQIGSIPSVPEPASLMLLGASLLGLGLARRTRV